MAKLKTIDITGLKDISAIMDKCHIVFKETMANKDNRAKLGEREIAVPLNWIECKAELFWHAASIEEKEKIAEEKAELARKIAESNGVYCADTFTGFTGSIIGETPFSSLTVFPDHPTLTSVDGILYSRDLTRAVKCPAGFIGDVTVPDSVTVIGETAFYMTKSITSLTLPETLEQIERFGICDLTALTSPVHLPASLRSIADSGFRGVLMEESVVCPCPCMIDPSAFTLSHGADEPRT